MSYLYLPFTSLFGHSCKRMPALLTLYLIFIVHIRKLIHLWPIAYQHPLGTDKHAMIRLTGKVPFTLNPTQEPHPSVPLRHPHRDDSRPIILPHRLIQPHSNPIPHLLPSLAPPKPSLPDKLDRPTRFIPDGFRRRRASSGMKDDTSFPRRLVWCCAVRRCW